MAEIRNLTRNGETFYPLTCSDAVLNRDGEPLGLVNDIFDISEYNASGTPSVLAKYDTLSLALAAVPTSKQKGGMTIRYVQTSDNKYVQYRLMANVWSTTENDWQGVDEVPTAGSNNLVKSSGVAKSFGLWCYFTGDSVPSIEISNTTVSIVFPPSHTTLNIYSGTHTRIFQILCTGQSFTLSNLNRLVVNFDGTMEVVDNDHTGSYVVLISNKYGRIGGLLADYYYNREINDVRDQVNTYMWWSNGGDPVILISGETVSVTFPASDKYWNIKRKDGVSIVSGMTAGMGQTFEVGSYKVLIFDRTDRTVKVVNNDNDALKDCFVFLMNVRGKYFTGLLEPFIVSIIKDNATIATASAYFVGLNNPEIWLNGTTINIAMPPDNAAIRVYLTDGNVFYITDAVGKTFAIPNLNRLVLDKSDNTTKVVANDAAGNYYNLLVNCNLNVSGLLSTYYRQYQVSIKALYDNQKEKLIFQNLKKTNPTVHEPAGYTPLVLLHFSDLHGRPENLSRIMQYKSQFSAIDDIINTGDTVTDEYANGYDFFTEIDGTENILTVIGNHDVLERGQGDIHAGKDVYDMEIAPFVSNWGVVQPTNAATNGLCYYYKDYANAGVRLIVLDNFATDMNAQVSWFSSVLEDARENELTVVASAHFPCPTILDKDITFCSIDGRYPDTTQEALLNAVDNFISTGGKFACWITGHTHEDLFGLVLNHTSQLAITITTASFDRNSGSSAKVVGTKSQDSFNIFSVDANTKCIKLHRVGADRDRYMRHIGELCYNYETKTLVYND